MMPKLQTVINLLKGCANTTGNGLNDIESAILRSVLDTACSDHRRQLLSQINNIKYVQRNVCGKEVNLYGKSHPKMVGSSARLPNCDGERLYAVVRLVANGTDNCARIWLVNGLIFSILYNLPVPEKATDIEIIKTRICYRNPASLNDLNPCVDYFVGFLSDEYREAFRNRINKAREIATENGNYLIFWENAAEAIGMRIYPVSDRYYLFDFESGEITEGIGNISNHIRRMEGEL